jgi:hypothetical protein
MTPASLQAPRAGWWNWGENKSRTFGLQVAGSKGMHKMAVAGHALDASQTLRNWRRGLRPRSRGDEKWTGLHLASSRRADRVCNRLSFELCG